MNSSSTEIKAKGLEKELVHHNGVTSTKMAMTPKPPYYCVVFTSELSSQNEGYTEAATRMVELAHQQPGFLGLDSAREELGISVSYWTSLQAIKNWKQQSEHLESQRLGREKWYRGFTLRIAKVERDYRFSI